MKCLLDREAYEAVKATGRGMPPSQAAGGGSILGQSDAPGCPVKKALKPSQRRRLVDDLRLRYGVSSRKACLVMKLSRSVYYSTRQHGFTDAHQRDCP